VSALRKSTVEPVIGIINSVMKLINPHHYMPIYSLSARR